jgi:hypothetical protein
MAAATGRQAIAGFERIRRGIRGGKPALVYLADRAAAYSDLVITLARARTNRRRVFRVADEARGRALVEHLGGAARGFTRARLDAR